ncbi:hypothetical protein [uncultured Duncaniella sp.]|uniref:hypothetical protein n=1 Tax=uncultured Duncaniella sp. TaxID=2768039 RepID=UPI00260A32BF|nr:hypothetical protein [uncultured Duncaniella sp.]
MKHVEDKDKSSLYEGRMKQYELDVKHNGTQPRINLFSGMERPAKEDYQLASNMKEKDPIRFLAWAIECKRTEKTVPMTKLDRAICELALCYSTIAIRSDGTIYHIISAPLNELEDIINPLAISSSTVHMVYDMEDLSRDYGTLQVETDIYAVLYGLNNVERLAALKNDAPIMANALELLRIQINKWLGGVDDARRENRNDSNS